MIFLPKSSSALVFFSCYQCQKSSKSVKNVSTLFDISCAGQKTSKIVKKCQKYFRHFLTIFARHRFPAPFGGLSHVRVTYTPCHGLLACEFYTWTKTISLLCGLCWIWRGKGEGTPWRNFLKGWNSKHTEIAVIFAICDCDAHRGLQKSQRFPRQEKAVLHCDLRVGWKVASDLRFQAAISESKARQRGNR